MKITFSKLKKKLSKIVTGAVVTGQVFASVSVPIIANAADIIHPQEVTARYDVNQLYTLSGTLSNGNAFQTKSTHIYANYNGADQRLFCIEPGAPIDNPVTPGYRSNPLPTMSAQARYISVGVMSNI